MNLPENGGAATAPQPQNVPSREFKGVWIPAALWNRKDITWLQKCILAEIDSLSMGCFASNAYLAKQMGIKVQTLKNNLGDLRKKGLLIDWGTNGRQRQISVADNISSDPKHERYRKKYPRGTGKSTPDIPIPVPIDTSVVTNRDTNQSKEVRRRTVRVSNAEKDRLLREATVPKNAPSEPELHEIISRFPVLKKWRPDLPYTLQGTKFRIWRKGNWEPIKNLPELLARLERKCFIEKGKT